jgi:DNA-binding transcriptional MerR regulator
MSDYEALQALQASDKLYYRIGEVSKLTGVKAHVLRYWETEFRWMTPPKSRSKQRLYRSRDIEFVWLLKRLLWDERYTIAGARQRIQDLGVEDALALLQQKPGTSDARSASPPVADWASFRSALDEMQSDLMSLQGVLRETA